MSLDGVHMERRDLEQTARGSNGHQHQSGRAPESVNRELISGKFRRSATRDSVYDVFVARKMRVHTDAEFE
jgi:hypothetical protein